MLKRGLAVDLPEQTPFKQKSGRKWLKRVCSGKSTAKPRLSTFGVISASRGFALASPLFGNEGMEPEMKPGLNFPLFGNEGMEPEMKPGLYFHVFGHEGMELEMKPGLYFPLFAQLNFHCRCLRNFDLE